VIILEKKKKLKIKIYAIIGFLIIAVNLSNRTDIGAPDDILKGEDTINDLKIPNQSSLWEVEYIHIDNNWSDAANDLDWVQGGDGSISDPYIIENVKINAQSTGTGILIENSIDYFIIRNCIIYNSGNSGYDAGIKLINVRNSQIINNNCSLNRYGIVLYWNCINNQVLKNILNNNTHSGMYIHRCDGNTVTGNTVEFNGVFGIWLWYSHGNTFEKNDANKNNLVGIFLQYSNSSDIIGNEVNENIIEHGIKLDNSNKNLLKNNTMNKNEGNGIYLTGTEGCHYNVIDGNVAIDNDNDGIKVWGSTNNFFMNNIVADSFYNGIFIASSRYNVFDGNFGMDNGHNAICLVDCNNSIVKNTFGKNNSHNGIYLRDSNEILISGNEFIENKFNGIFLDDTCLSNSLENNILYNNSGDGISIIDDSSNNNITGNIIKNNMLSGVTLQPLTSDNLFYENFFLQNGVQAVDDGLNNEWNSTSIGNYWDNWTTPDITPPFGIVDDPFPYIGGSAGSIDYFPIVDDTAPTVTINSPTDDDIFGLEAPNYNVTITDDFLFEMWYTMDGGLHNYTFTGFTGTIDQSAWDAMADGIITLTFYASDKAGNIRYKSIIIIKSVPGAKQNNFLIWILIGAGISSFALVTVIILILKKKRVK